MKRGTLSYLLVFIVFSINLVSAQTCTDSDNGVNYYVKGQAIVSENGTSLSYDDACIYKLEETSVEFYVKEGDTLYNNKAECSDSDCYVAEAFCENNAKKWTVKICQNGCSNGACKCPTTKCSDGTVYLPDKCSVKENVCVCPSCPAVKPTQTCSIPSCNGARDTGNKYSNNCPIYECPATPVCQPTKCSDGSVYECKIIDNICTCPTCPAVTTTTPATFYISGVEGIKKTYFPSETLNLIIKGAEKDGTPASAEEGFNVQFYIDEWPLVQEQGSKGDNAYYKEGYWYGSIAVPNKLANYRLQIFLYCSRDNSYCSKNYGIKGAQVENTYYFSIINGEQITEKVICGFVNSQQEQKCYTAYQNERAYCSGAGTCTAEIKGYKGEQITWKSTCGEYKYTTMDGTDEKIEFECKSGETSATEIKNKGFRKVYFQCYDGAESKSTDREACKSADYWKKFAINFCASHCENGPGKCKQKYENQEDIDKCLGKCGINSFSIGEECYLEEMPVSETIVSQPVQTMPGTAQPVIECKTDDDCPKLKCGEEEKCPGIEYKCMEGKCIEKELEIVVCKDSCPLDGKCYQFGYRKSGKYCSDSGEFVAQLEGNEVCDNNFECSSNVCIDSKCVSSGLIQKIMAWFGRLFGG